MGAARFEVYPSMKFEVTLAQRACEWKSCQIDCCNLCASTFSNWLGCMHFLKWVGGRGNFTSFLSFKSSCALNDTCWPYAPAVWWQFRDVHTWVIILWLAWQPLDWKPCSVSLNLQWTHSLCTLLYQMRKNAQVPQRRDWHSCHRC